MRVGIRICTTRSVSLGRARIVGDGDKFPFAVVISIHGFGVGEADSGRLVDEEHIADLGEGVWVVVDFAVVVDTAWAEFLEQTNHGRRARTAVDPDGERRLMGVDIAGLEEPEEDVLVLFDVGVTRKAFDLGVELTDTRRYLLVAHRDTGMANCFLEIRRLGDELGDGIAGKSSKQEQLGEGGEHGRQMVAAGPIVCIDARTTEPLRSRGLRRAFIHISLQSARNAVRC